jgi:hypothetical protein
MHVGVLPEIQGRKMESERLDGSNQTSQRAAGGEQACAAFTQRMRDLDQIRSESLGIRIRLASARGRPRRCMTNQFAIRRCQPCINADHSAPIRLI